jgi:hypothetical protein
MNPKKKEKENWQDFLSHARLSHQTLVWDYQGSDLSHILEGNRQRLL